MINTNIDRPSDATIVRFRELLNYASPTCALSDSMGRFGAMTSDMRPIFDNIRFVGTAVTVKALASDLAPAFKAIDLCRPGDVIVIDSHHSIHTAFWGENMALSALNRGVVGALVDGACRDVEELRQMRFPVLCKGITPNVGSISGYGHVNVPIQCAGVPVSPGDIVVVDGNGAVVVPRDEAAVILKATQRLLDTEAQLTQKIRQGATIGELTNIDAVFNNAFAYQERATAPD